jgi:hypothetical protein
VINIKYWQDVVILILLNVVMKLLLPFHMFNDNYWFLDGSSPYYLKVDSYFYYQILSDIGLSKFLIYILPYIFTIISIVIFYFILVELKVNRKVRLVATIAMMVFPYFYNQTLLGYVDTPHFIIFCIMLFTFAYLRLIKSLRNRRWYISIGWCILCVAVPLMLYFVWTGFPILTMFFGLGIYLQLANNWKMYIIGVIIAFLIFLEYNTRFIKLLNMKMWGVSEYATPKLLIYYILIIVVLVLFWQFYKTQGLPEWKFLLGCMLYCAFFSFFIGRFAAFTIIFVMLLLGVLSPLYFTSDKHLTAFWLIIICAGLLLTVPLQAMNKPVMNKAYEGVLSNGVATYDVVSFWDERHLIKTFTNTQYKMGSSIYKYLDIHHIANGFSLDINDAVLYLDNASRSMPYYLVLSTYDLYKIQNIQKYVKGEYSDNNIIEKSLKHEHTIYFDLIAYDKYQGTEYFLYERVV